VPINEADKLVHLGAGANYRDSHGANAVRFKQAPETHIAGVNIVDTGTILAAKNVVKLGAELATVFGPFSAQAEYISTSVNRNEGSNLVFDGWYVETAYFLTGESRQYKQGKFAKPLPKSKVGQDGVGAWQLALRYSTLDLNDGLVEGGEVDAMTLGLNWFPTPTLRFTANYVDVLDTDGGPNDGLGPSLFQLRSQWVF
jgi:phosphate-selective porin OprO/OprP